MAKLTKAQSEMLATCLETGAAWTTSRRDNENLTLLRSWERAGWAKVTPSPAEFLISFSITPAGRSALTKEKQDG